MISLNNYKENVFMNVPFDDAYLELRNALIFTIFDCGFVPRCALEEDNAANVRIDKIAKLIEQSKYGVHDISRTELDDHSNLPRFNMPLELGVFFGAKFFGTTKHKRKNSLILDKAQYRYQSFISDIAGYDVRSHNNAVHDLIRNVRNWLNTANEKKDTIPGGSEILNRFERFKADLPTLCRKIKLQPNEITYNDYTVLMAEWLRKANSTSESITR